MRGSCLCRQQDGCLRHAISARRELTQKPGAVLECVVAFADGPFAKSQLSVPDIRRTCACSEAAVEGIAPGKWTDILRLHRKAGARNLSQPHKRRGIGCDPQDVGLLRYNYNAAPAQGGGALLVK